eukprot:GHVR01000471.1.p1 GENE.GHVR01000471.1~~GHVR01000471.1.p1  ORF type:complete len:107 (-),score=3.10 GHVR01000471.1:468-788(-)
MFTSLNSLTSLRNCLLSRSSHNSRNLCDVTTDIFVSLKIRLGHRLGRGEQLDEFYEVAACIQLQKKEVSFGGKGMKPLNESLKVFKLSTGSNVVGIQGAFNVGCLY